jgi:hypothetical protein
MDTKGPDEPRSLTPDSQFPIPNHSQRPTPNCQSDAPHAERNRPRIENLSVLSLESDWTSGVGSGWAVGVGTWEFRAGPLRGEADP